VYRPGVFPARWTLQKKNFRVGRRVYGKPCPEPDGHPTENVDKIFLDKAIESVLAFQTVACPSDLVDDPGGETMPRIVFLVAIALMSVCLACKNNTRTIEEDAKPTGLSQVEIDAAKATAEMLLPNFNYLKDEFDKSEIYGHKILNREKIGIMIFIGDGLMIEYISYYGTSWLFIDRCYVSIDGEVLNVELQDSRDMKREDRGNYVSEIFTPSHIRRGTISRFIAANPDKIVRVRLQGSNDRHDFTLDKIEQKAICEVVKFYDALMILKRAGIDPLTDLKAKPISII
jgi:hypothetical protein